MRAADLTGRQRTDLLMATAARRDYFAKFRKRMDAWGGTRPTTSTG